MTDGRPVIPTEGYLHFRTVWIGAECQTGRAHCGVKVPRGRRAIGKLVEYPVEVDSLETYTTSMKVNQTFMEVLLLLSKLVKYPMESIRYFHGSKATFHGRSKMQVKLLLSMEVFTRQWK